MVKGWTPVAVEIEQVNWPALSMVKIICFGAKKSDHMMIVVGNKKMCESF